MNIQNIFLSMIKHPHTHPSKFTSCSMIKFEFFKGIVKILGHQPPVSLVCHRHKDLPTFKHNIHLSLQS